jgi:hypothetical protein
VSIGPAGSRHASEAVVQVRVERMHTVNPALNAVVVNLSEQAISDARAADRAKASGAALGKLHGVRVTIKINIDVEGQANSNGVIGFKDNIAPGDSPVTANLKKAGATLNPLDNAISCGGSCGGAGASSTQDMRSDVPPFIGRHADHRVSEDVVADRKARWFIRRYNAACCCAIAMHHSPPISASATRRLHRCSGTRRFQSPADTFIQPLPRCLR